MANANTWLRLEIDEEVTRRVAILRGVYYTSSPPIDCLLKSKSFSFWIQFFLLEFSNCRFNFAVFNTRPNQASLQVSSSRKNAVAFCLHWPLKKFSHLESSDPKKISVANENKPNKIESRFNCEPKRASCSNRMSRLNRLNQKLINLKQKINRMTRDQRREFKQWRLVL